MKELYALFAATAIAAATPAPSATASMALLARATDPNPTLNSYTASAQLSAQLRAVIPVNKTFPGKVYYLRPNRKIEFQGVSGPLSKFKDLASTTPTYDQAMQQYAITPLGDNGTLSTYSCVPKKSGGRVKNVVVAINDRSALLDSVQWNYTNGGKLTFSQTYTNVGNFRLPAKATISARFPGYSVDGTLTFSNYAPNATVSPSVFASPSS
ncbi:MAG: hypothetical protein JO104_12250 [Candidatus Eremiobacteraeota bacterium]|nr:hypothetical protein [Candidatus Eremiobacteraeota bacterium]